MKKPVPAAAVKGTKDFMTFYSALHPNDALRKEIDGTLDSLKLDATAGTKVQRRLWPKLYVQKFGLSNLFKLDLKGGWRLTYTIVSELNQRVVVVLEVLSHKEYGRRFGYSM